MGDLNLRALDIGLSIAALVILSPLLCILWILGSAFAVEPLFKQVRVGRYGQEFIILKFSTMKAGVGDLPTHLTDCQDITRYGRVLRKFKLDELPQLINVLRGEMSLVGPRPSLPSQFCLLEARKALGVLDVRPGITGIAQLSGIDMSNPELLASTDLKMIKELDFFLYLKLVILTALGQRLDLR